jgi:hypothetical protein
MFKKMWIESAEKEDIKNNQMEVLELKHTTEIFF